MYNMTKGCKACLHLRTSRRLFYDVLSPVLQSDSFNCTIKG